MTQPFALELNGAISGRLYSFLNAGTKVVVAPGAAAGPPIFGPLEFQFGTGMSNTFYKWIDGFEGARMSGSVLDLASSTKTRSRLQFENAIVKSITIPALDSRSGTDGYMSVELMPEAAKVSATPEEVKLGVYGGSLASPWKTDSFVLSIDGVNTKKVVSVSSVSMGQAVIHDSVGSPRRAPEMQPGAVRYSNITLEVPELYAEGFLKWHETSLIDRRPWMQEKVGTIEILSPGKGQVYFTIGLKGLGILSVSKRAGMVQVTMYCSEITFGASASVVK